MTDARGSAHSCLAPTRKRAPGTPADQTSATEAPHQAYARLFPELPPLEIEEELLCAMGRQGGACDGESFAGRDADDARGAAGWPFFGQLVAHDISGDRSALVHHADVAALRNARRQKINLEFLYGAGPAGDPYLFDASDPAKLLLGRNEAGRADDVQRNAQGTAIIGDPRNDTHLVMAQLHLAFCRLHNVMVDRLRSQRVPEADLFERARRLLRWHYQWVVLHDFLPRVVGPALAEELLGNGARYYHPGDDPYVPLEFADAAYRYGHAQIRHSYRLNGAMPPRPIFPDLLGFRPVPAAHVIDWAYLFDIPGHPPAQRAKKIDGRLCASLITLPAAITGEVTVDAYRSLAARDLQRGLAVSLPSGEAVANRLGITPLTAQETGLAASGWEGETPLWYYILKEAEVCTEGDHLGAVGGRIVGDVLVGLMDHDPGSFRVAAPDWRPELPAAEPGSFTVADLLTLARAEGPITVE
ncbi:MAG TPA: heme peroxidase family protein [Candidatus Eisenbacteria bacterium]|nr:heme peroxidase family protein [Candidatus Eisenbacteria bacterium]